MIILDIRVPCTPVARLSNHRACVNGIGWAPHSSCHICTAGQFYIILAQFWWCTIPHLPTDSFNIFWVMNINDRIIWIFHLLNNQLKFDVFCNPIELKLKKRKNSILKICFLYNFHLSWIIIWSILSILQMLCISAKYYFDLISATNQRFDHLLYLKVTNFLTKIFLCAS